MAGTVDPAVVTALYSVLLVAVALLMSRQGTAGTLASAQPEGDGPLSRLFRGTGVSLCAVAFCLPLIRAVTTRGVVDLVILAAAMGLSLAAAAYLTRNRDESARPDPDPRSRPGSRTGSRSGSTAARVAAAGGQSRAARAIARAAASGDAPYAAAPAGADRAGAHLEHGHGPADQGPAREAGLAAETLHEVDQVVDDVAHRLGLSPTDTSPIPVHHPDPLSGTGITGITGGQGVMGGMGAGGPVSAPTLASQAVIRSDGSPVMRPDGTPLIQSASVRRLPSPTDRPTDRPTGRP